MLICGGCGADISNRESYHICGGGGQTGSFPSTAGGEIHTGKVEVNFVDGGGLRYDTGKLRYDLIPTKLLEHLAAVYTYGAGKYADWNWARGMKWSRITGSLFRHLIKFFQGERLDPESGLPHLAHAFWNLGTLLFYSETPGYEQYDDRYEKGGTDGVQKTA